MAREAKGNVDRQLIIHCGVQKSGSTAFHHFLSRNHDVLSPWLEVFTPKAGTVTRQLGRTAGLYSLDTVHKAELTDLIGQMRETILVGQGPCLLSHENLPGAMIGRTGVTSLYPKIVDILALLDRHFAPLRPTYVFYTREMSSWKSSVYSQAVLTDGYCETRQVFLKDTADCGSWADFRARAEAAVGPERCCFLALEDEAETDKPGLQLLRLAGVPDDVITTLRPMKNRPNQSLNAGSLEFLRHLNGVDLPDRARRSVAQVVRQNQNAFVTEEATQ